MELKTYRAKSMQEALALVRRDLGPQAAVLHTREVNGSGLMSWLPGLRRIEVTAALNVNVPSRIPVRETVAAGIATMPALEPAAPAQRSMPVSAPELSAPAFVPPTLAAPSPTSSATNSRSIAPAQPAMPDPRAAFRAEVRGQLNELQSLVEDLCRRSKANTSHDLPGGLFEVYTALLDADVPEDTARTLVERLRERARPADWSDRHALNGLLVNLVSNELPIAGPLELQPGACRVVALVGPTGVGKTTTIAKLAANFRLRDQRRVGLITVDTYRIAAVEQLRTYAEIIDLPMEVVTSASDMRAAVDRLSNLDLILIDTAGRSPKDDLQIQELQLLLQAARADEVHLVMSGAAGSSTLQRTAARFATVGARRLILTKLDEAATLGQVLPMLMQPTALPLSYLTNGQNVPDDIVAATPDLAHALLGFDEQMTKPLRRAA